MNKAKDATPSQLRGGAQPARNRMSAAEQRRRFEETARELGCDEGQALEAAFSKIVPPKRPKERNQPTPKPS